MQQQLTSDRKIHLIKDRGSVCLSSYQVRSYRMSNTLGSKANKSLMSETYYFRCKSLHALLTFTSKTQRIQVGNGHYARVLFFVPAIIDIHSHRFEIFILVSKIYENKDLVSEIKNIFELEGIINSRVSCFSFLNRSTPFFLKEQVILKPRK